MIVQIYEIKTPETALELAGLGVDHLGMVVCEAGERRPGWIDSAAARAIAGSLRGLPVKSSLIVISTDLEEIAGIAEKVRPDILHLSMHPEQFPVGRVRELRQALPGQALMQAVPVGGRETRERALRLADEFAPHVDYLIIDTKDQEAVGATGVLNDWTIGRELVEQSPVPVILAGGLSPDNVAEAIRAVRPWGVDSMTHTNRPGSRFEKDPERVRRFVQAARAAFADLANKIEPQQQGPDLHS